MKNYAILGYPLKHTMSPPIHKRLFELSGVTDFSYDIKEISSEELENSIPMLNSLDGYNITIPHKVDIIKYVTKLDESALRYNSVNCIKNTEGIITGYNTDCYGFLRALKAGGASLDGKVLQFGCGGAGRMITVEAVLHGADLTVVALPEFIASAKEVVDYALSLNPDAKARVITIDEIEGEFDLLINATPVGMFPHNDACPCDESIIKRCKFVFDIIYNPDVTKLMKIAMDNGIKAIGGMAMLVWQAVVAHEIWDNVTYNDDDIAALINDMREELTK